MSMLRPNLNYIGSVCMLSDLGCCLISLHSLVILKGTRDLSLVVLVDVPSTMNLAWRTSALELQVNVHGL